MGSDIISHIIAVGMFYHKISIACKKMSFIHFRFSDILFSLYVRFFKFIKAGLTMFRSNFTAMSFCLIIIYTLIIAGDVELNPGPGETPVNFEDHCLSIFHGNIRSLRNKVDYISNIIEDYDILFFTETHLDKLFSMSYLHFNLLNLLKYFVAWFFIRTTYIQQVGSLNLRVF
jgi:hypothetical protein